MLVAAKAAQRLERKVSILTWLPDVVVGNSKCGVKG